ncbi:hypothetical protein PRK78_005348 [Emydomyces testavorans]|uniref:Uncharacterized protein n=1 Tax=Emydomyces testavorans TaxID=2070801 RepID=A0AAF0DJL4_9EURO|nr:hypothetical protein PRK78_005348 [Emydomyces testavorans]
MEREKDNGRFSGPASSLNLHPATSFPRRGGAATLHGPHETNYSRRESNQQSRLSSVKQHRAGVSLPSDAVHGSPSVAPDQSLQSDISGHVEELIAPYRNASLDTEMVGIPYTHPSMASTTTREKPLCDAFNLPTNTTSRAAQYGGYGNMVNFPLMSWPAGQQIAPYMGAPLLQGTVPCGTSNGFGSQMHVSFANPQAEGHNAYIPHRHLTSVIPLAHRPALTSGDFDKFRASSGSDSADGAKPVALEPPSSSKALMKPKPPRPQGLASGVTRALGALEVAEISQREAVFSFFILAIQKKLKPRIEYKAHFDSKWVVRLTFAGQTLEPQLSFESKFAAKVHVCREGYCDLQKLPRPDYTPYTHKQGHRHEVTVDGTSYFGVKKFYKTVTEAVHASAHNALYRILVFENEFPLENQRAELATPYQSELLGSAVKAMQEALSNKKSKSTATKSQASSVDYVVLTLLLTRTQTPKKKKPSPKAASTSTKVQKSGGKRKGRSSKISKCIVQVKPCRSLQGVSGKTDAGAGHTAAPKITKGNANLTSLGTKQRFLTAPETSESPSCNLKLTTAMLNDQLRSCNAYSEKVEKICQLMGIQAPEFRITQTPEGFRNGQADAAAYFSADPYLARVGAIGEVKFVRPKEMAKEACAAEVVKFLIKMVEEDEYWAKMHSGRR